MQSKTTTFALIALCGVLGVLLLLRASGADPENKALQARVAALTQELASAKAAKPLSSAAAAGAGCHGTQ